MNAYDLLGIDDIVNNEGSNVDDIIKNRAINELNKKIEEIEQILSQGTDIQETLGRVAEKLGEAIQYAIAYDFSATEKERRKYEEKGKVDIARFSAELSKKLNAIYSLMVNNRAWSAYQILGVINDERGFRTVDEQNKNINNRALNYLKLTINGLKNNSFKMNEIDSIEESLLMMVKYMWAYSNINTLEKRKEYKYKEFSSKGDIAKKSIGTPEARELKSKRNCIMQPRNENDCTKIELSEVVVLQSCPFVVPEKHAGGYIVSKYRAEVQRMLLSDEAIKMGQKYLGGYVGEIDKDGNIVFLPEAIGASKKWAHIREVKRRQGENRENTRRTTNPESPDAGDRE